MLFEFNLFSETVVTRGKIDMRQQHQTLLPEQLESCVASVPVSLLLPFHFLEDQDMPA